VNNTIGGKTANTVKNIKIKSNPQQNADLKSSISPSTTLKDPKSQHILMAGGK
jgi:hypothetical protein